MKWITRKNVKVDRVACPWLIKRFVDNDAEFIFVEEDQLVSLAESMKAIPYDAPRIPEIKLNHRGQRCTFEAIIEDYKISDSALAHLALIVRAADVKGQEHVAAEGQSRQPYVSRDHGDLPELKRQGANDCPGYA